MIVTSTNHYHKIGARNNSGNSCDFTVWAPHAKQVKLCIEHPNKKQIDMTAKPYSYWHKKLDDSGAATRYMYKPDLKNPLSEPASLYQPLGVHGPSEVRDLTQFKWTDHRRNIIPLEEMIFYELHTGTFTKEGDFQGIIAKLDYLNDLGINTLELMPVGQFPGTKNWDYDGVYPFAVQQSYGGPGYEALPNLETGRNVTVHRETLHIYSR